MTVHSVRINSSGRLRLPDEVVECLQLQFGDELLIRIIDQTLEVRKAKGSVHPYADWRAISHDLIDEDSASAAIV